jgi:hypothetical protein
MNGLATLAYNADIPASQAQLFFIRNKPDQYACRA